MQSRTLKIFTFCLFTVSLLLSSCDYFGDSIPVALNEFVNDLNSAEPRNVSENFHSLMTGGSDAWDATALDATSLATANKTFYLLEISTPVDSSLGTDIKHLTAQLVYYDSANTVYAVATIRFNMQKDAGVWRILAMDIPAAGEIFGSAVTP